jgi:hypothetical protein
MTHQKAAALEPLRDLLGEVIGRLEALETKVGISAPPASSSLLKQSPAISSTSAVVAPGRDLAVFEEWEVGTILGLHKAVSLCAMYRCSFERLRDVSGGSATCLTCPYLHCPMVQTSP